VKILFGNGCWVMMELSILATSGYMSRGMSLWRHRQPDFWGLTLILALHQISTHCHDHHASTASCSPPADARIAVLDMGAVQDSAWHRDA